MDVETTFTGFANRTEAGSRLADALRRYRDKDDAIVLALPRGGVVVGAAIADALNLPLDVLIVRKLGTPGQEELAMGAIGPGGVRVLNEPIVEALRVPRERIEAVTRREEVEMARRERLYRAHQPPLSLAGKTVIVVDDGLATGSTMFAAIAVIRQHAPRRILAAVPVAPPDTIQRLNAIVDELVYLETPDPFTAVGYWYVDFDQVDDGQVVTILEAARTRNLV
jgi:predicted phosphoribosyltransferase